MPVPHEYETVRVFTVPTQTVALIVLLPLTGLSRKPNSGLSGNRPGSSTDGVEAEKRLTEHTQHVLIGR